MLKKIEILGLVLLVVGCLKKDEQTKKCEGPHCNVQTTDSTPPSVDMTMDTTTKNWTYKITFSSGAVPQGATLHVVPGSIANDGSWDDEKKAWVVKDFHSHVKVTFPHDGKNCEATLKVKSGSPASLSPVCKRGGRL